MEALKVQLQPKQSELWRLWDKSPCRRLGIGGARGGGKSGAARLCLLTRLGNYRNTKGLLLRRTYPELYKGHVLELFRQFPVLRSGYNDQRHELLLPNGSRLFFGSAEHEADMSQYYGLEFSDIVVDEAQEFSQEELERLGGSNRCTSNPDITPKMVYTFMPGLSPSGLPPKGLPYLRRVFIDKNLSAEEQKVNWAFVQAFAWDNAMWAKAELDRDGITLDEFYGWTEAERREYYLTRTDYGTQLLSITDPQLRDAWLYGKWDIFEGQYFPQFSYERHTVADEEIEIKPWHKRWMSGDWGVEHPACFHWFAEDEHGQIVTYRELWLHRASEAEMAAQIASLTGAEKLSAFYFSWDAFGKLNPKTKQSIVQMIGNGLPKHFPKPTPADATPGSRISGWRLMSQLLDADQWKIARSCTKLIECLPILVRDMEKNPEDVLKVDHSSSTLGDDPADSARYGLQNMLSLPVKPRSAVMQERLAEVVASEPDPSQAMQKQAMAALWFNKNYKNPLRSFRLNRPRYR